MSYHITRTLNLSFEQAVERAREAIAGKGFGVLCEIDVQGALKKKLDADIRPYLILGACHPPSAYRAIQAESKIGTMLPCNVLVQENEDGTIDVSAVDPMASMMAIENPDLGEVAAEVKQMLTEIIEAL